MLRASAIVFVLALGLSACGGKGEETAPPRDEAPAAEAQIDDESRGGWRWKGKREDCFFKVENHCFASLAEACKAAGCGDAECVKDGAAPANVSCEE